MILWIQGWRWLCALPLLLILAISATDFLILTNLSDAAKSLFFEELPVPFDDTRRDAAESLKVKVLQYVYIGLLIICTLQWRKILGYFLEWRHLILLVVVLLAGVFHSIEPVKVITNSILIVIGFLATVLFASAYSSPGHYDGFFHIVFWPMFVIHVASLYVLTLYNINPLDFLGSTQRYGGLAGNPNSLGSTAVLGVWASACMLLSSNSSRFVRSLSCLGLAVFLISTALSGSGSSTATILIVFVALVWLRVLAAFRAITRLIINSSLILAMMFVVLYAFLVTTPAEMFISITGSMGKDATLTGRTEIWAIARDAISMKPLLGWGFDSHQSVMAERAFDLRFNHYHNGFLDTMIAGGAILLALVLYNLVKFCQIFFRTFREQPSAFPLLLPFIILLVLNVSEYSLLRPNSQLWLVYFLSFAMLTYDSTARVLLQIKFTDKRRRRSSRRRKNVKLRWG